ncbi:MAG: hypothetical protein R3D25_09660 [Geminicoccaceae bacterium]
MLRSIPTIPLWMGLRGGPAAATCIIKYLADHGHHLADRLDRARPGGAWPVPVAARGGLRHGRPELAGASQMRIIFATGPSFLSHIIAAVSLALPAMIISETTLSFLGLGLRPPAISWGVLLQDAQNNPSSPSPPGSWQRRAARDRRDPCLQLPW